MAGRKPSRLAGGFTYLWMSARARNALRRVGVMASIATAIFVGAIIAFILVPRKASRRAEAVAAHIEAKIDSTPAALLVTEAHRQISIADSLLAAGRRNREVAAAFAPDTFPPAVIARRDTLSSYIARLDTLLIRAENSPLPSSFRVLAAQPLLASDPQMHALADSLALVERDRAAFGALGASDPGYAALSSRAAELGRRISAVAEARKERLRAELAAIRPPASSVPQPVFVDTMRFLSDRALAAQNYLAATTELTRIRQENERVDREAEHARDLANLEAPPAAMLTAALVLAAALAFAGSLALELRRPNVADAREAEQVTRERVLAVIGRAATVVERGRRQADIDAPPLIDVVSEAYRALYLHIASLGAGLPIVTVTGDEPEIVAAVASNLAASAAYEARSALLMDIDATTASVASVLRIAPDPGLSAILAGRSTWAEAIRPTTIGRDRPLDVLPSGSKRVGALEAHVVDKAKEDFAKLQRRYDFIIIAAPTVYVQRTETSIIPTKDVLLTVRLGRTKVGVLKTAAESLRGAGMKIQGLVLWDAPFPHLEKRQQGAPLSRRGQP